MYKGEGKQGKRKEEAGKHNARKNGNKPFENTERKVEGREGGWEKKKNQGILYTGTNSL